MKPLVILFLAGGIIYGVYQFVVISEPGSTIETNATKDEVRINDAVFTVDIADTFIERTQGLSGRPSLGENEGLLFVFDQSNIHSFWMKGMNFPIDIIWINNEQRIVHIEHDLSPDTYPQSFAPEEAALYVLEINAGKAKENGISLGDWVTLPI